jgi:hypothetical protein
LLLFDHTLSILSIPFRLFGESLWYVCVSPPTCTITHKLATAAEHLEILQHLPPSIGNSGDELEVFLGNQQKVVKSRTMNDLAEFGADDDDGLVPIKNKTMYGRNNEKT